MYFGAVDVLNGELFCQSYDMMNTDNMEDFLARLQAEYKDDYIVLVADGALAYDGQAAPGPTTCTCRSCIHIAPS